MKTSLVALALASFVSSAIAVNVTVGPSGDYQTLGAALDYAVGLGGADPVEIVMDEGTYAVPQRDISVPVRIVAAANAEVKLDFQQTTYVLPSVGLRLTNASSSIENVNLYRIGENSLYMENGAKILNCQVIDAYTQTGGTAKGGGIYLKDGSIMDGCYVANANGAYVYYNHVVSVAGGSKLLNTTFEGCKQRHYLVTVSGADSVVSNCVFRNNNFANAGGTNPDYRVMNIDAGLVTHCKFIGNGRTDNTYCREGTVRLKGANAILRNCLLIGNKASSAPGIYVDNGTVENCTVVKGIRNPDRTASGLDLTLKAGIVRNCIFYSEPGIDSVNRTGGSLTYSFSSVAEAGEGNISGVPNFTDYDNDDFTLTFGSICRNAGTNQTWMASATDLAGSARIIEDIVDMGCYEKEAMPAGYIEALVNYTCQGVAQDGTSLIYSFTAITTPSDAACTWYIDNVEQADHTKTPTFTLPPSATVHDVKLRATKGAGSEEVSCLIAVPMINLYCKAGNESAAYPYDTENTAAASLADLFTTQRPAEDTRKMTVTMLEGNYLVHELKVYGPLSIASKQGDTVSLDMQGQESGLWMYGDVELSGVTIVNGNDYALKLYDGASISNCVVYKAHSTIGGTSNKGIVRVFDGNVTDCTFDGCWGEYCYHAPPLWMEKGTAANCLFVNNRRFDYLCRIDSNATLTNSVFRNNPLNGGGVDNIHNQVLTSSGTVVDCMFLTNGCNSATRYGTVRVTGGIVRNCLLAGNTAYAYPGIYIEGNGTVENCTVVGGTDNPKAAAGGLDLWMNQGTVRNCIFYSDPNRDTVQKSGGTLTYSLMPVIKAGDGNKAVDPLFVAAPDDYTLQNDSLCRDSGTNQTWMAGANDLAGNPRIISDVVDMGCFEAAALPDDYMKLVLVSVCNGLGQDGESLSYTFTADTPETDLTCEWLIDNVVVPGETGGTLTKDMPARAEPYRIDVRVSAGVKYGTSFDTISVLPRIVYVATDGSNTYPYDTTNKAATTLSAALQVNRAAADSRSFEVQILAGTYNMSALSVPRATTIKAYGNGDSVLNSTADPGISMTFDDCALEGLTFKGVSRLIQLNKGTIRNCFMRDCGGQNSSSLVISGGLVDGLIVSNFYDKSWGYQYPITISAGELRNFVIEHSVGCSYNLRVQGGVVTNGIIRNWGESTRGWQDAVEHGGIKVDGGLVTHCVLTNLGDKVACRTGTILMSNGTVRNCLIADNFSTDCAGVSMSGGTLESCTVVVNDGDSTHLTGYGTFGSALNMSGGTARNCVFWSKETAEAGKYYVRKTGGTLINCWGNPQGGDPAFSGTDVLTGTDPSFKSGASSKFVPSSKSKLINAGIFQSWMTDGIDLRGEKRIKSKGVDIGAFEGDPNSLTLMLR